MKLDILTFKTDGRSAEVKCDVAGMDLKSAICDLNELVSATEHLYIKSMKIVFDDPGI